VQPGDTLFSIAIRYGVAWQNVATANNIPAPYIIYVGQTLVIPGCTG
jgi:LysM repeat protein